MIFGTHTITPRLLTSGLIATVLLLTMAAHGIGSQRTSRTTDQQTGPGEWQVSSARTVAFRAKPTLARQPRPTSAPIRHLDQRVDCAVTLLGIE